MRKASTSTLIELRITVAVHCILATLAFAPNTGIATSRCNEDGDLSAAR